MIDYLRYANAISSALVGPKLSPLDEHRLCLRVGLADVELSRVNNGRYLTLMDLGRVGLAIQCGLLPAMIRRRWTPLVSAVSIRFRRSLRVFQRFDLVTRVAAFDEKFWYFDQRFDAGGETCAAAFVKALFHGPRGSVPARDMLAAVGVPHLESPSMPERMRSWLESEASLRAAA